MYTFCYYELRGMDWVGWRWGVCGGGRGAYNSFSWKFLQTINISLFSPEYFYKICAEGKEVE